MTPRRRHLVTGAVALMAILIVLGGGAAIYRMPTSYTAASLLSVRPHSNFPLSAAGVEDIAYEYMVFLSSDRIATAVAGILSLPVEQVRGQYDVSVDAGSSVVRIEAKGSQPKTSIDIANAVAEEGAKRGGAGDSLVTTQVVSQASPATVKAEPPRLLLLAALSGATLLAAGAALASLNTRRPEGSSA